jgi:hypothetical protein
MRARLGFAVQILHGASVQVANAVDKHRECHASMTVNDQVCAQSSNLCVILVIASYTAHLLQGSTAHKMLVH